MADYSSRYSADLAATTLTDITDGGVAAGRAGSYLLNLCNRSDAEVTVRVAVTTGGAAGNADYLEYDAAIEPKGVLSRWPLPLGEGWKLFIWASATGVSANALGRKE